MPAKFRFRLEAVLRLRRQREDAAKRVVAERLGQIARVRAEIASLEQRIAAQIQALRDHASGRRIEVPALARDRHWLNYLRRCRLEAEGRLRGLEARLAEERAVLAHAAKEKKAIEKLKQRQYERHVRELERKETAQVDELATQRHALEMARRMLEETPGWSQWA